MKIIISKNQYRFLHENIQMKDESSKKLSFGGWADVWLKLRRQYGTTFLHPEDYSQNKDFPIFTGMNLDFIPKNDGEYLEVMEFYTDPKNWHNDYEKGIETLERIENKLRDRIENSNADLRFESDSRFNFRIYKN
jgi:hypothetical protein